MQTTEFYSYIKQCISHREYLKIRDIYIKEKHRYYHNWDHIMDVFATLQQSIKITPLLTESEKKCLYVAALIHDAVYQPLDKLNEISSYRNYIHLFDLSDIEKTLVYTLVMSTTYTKTYQECTMLERIFMEADLNIFNRFNHSIEDLYRYEDVIFKEYQMVPLNMYITERVKLLKQFAFKYDISNILPLIDYIQNKKYKIGFYPGSFNPFHIAHESVLQQAEIIFDKVIIGYGKNISKNNDTVIENKSVTNRQTVYYDKLITEPLSEFGHNVTIVRGLRNGSDLLAEQNLASTIKHYLRNQEFAYFFTAPELGFVSSSMIREIYKHNPNSINDFINKEII